MDKEIRCSRPDCRTPRLSYTASNGTKVKLGHFTWMDKEYCVRCFKLYEQEILRGDYE